MAQSKTLNHLPIDTLARPLGAGEQLFWWMNQTRKVQFVDAFEVAGTAPEHAWRRALDAVQQRHPLLRMSIQPHQEGEKTYPVFVPSSGCPIPLRIVPGAAAVLDWETELRRELATPFEATHAPLLRAVLMQNEDRSVLLLTVHHAISDGISLLFVVRDLLTALSGTSIEPLPLLQASEKLFGQTTADSSMPPVPPDSSRHLEYAPTAAEPFTARVLFDAEVTSALVGRARREGTTMHGALCAAAVLAGREAHAEWRDRDLLIDSPVSYRKMLGVEEDNGLYLGGGKMIFAPAPAATFWEIARSAREQISKAVSREAAAGFFQQLAGAAQGITKPSDSDRIASMAFVSDVMVTNVGVVPYPSEFGPLKLEAVWGALLMSFANLPTLTALTTNGRLCLLLADYSPVDALLMRIEHFLREAA